MPRRPHADIWRKIWFKLKDLGALGNMRVIFDLEGYKFEPDSFGLDFAKIASHQVESNVSTDLLPFFWANNEAAACAKKGGLCARVSPSYIMHFENVVNELKRASRFVAARLAQLPLHRQEPPRKDQRKIKSMCASGAAAPAVPPPDPCA